jgi:hypothetical protein
MSFVNLYDTAQSVRNLLGVDVEILSDSQVLDPLLLGLAEIKLIEWIPSISDPSYVSSLTNSELFRVKTSYAHLIAYYLCPSMVNRVDIEVRTLDLTWKKDKLDYKELGIKLLNTAYDLIVPLGVSFDKYDVFQVAPSKRAVSRDD